MFVQNACLNKLPKAGSASLRKSSGGKTKVKSDDGEILCRAVIFSAAARPQRAPSADGG